MRIAFECGQAPTDLAAGKLCVRIIRDLPSGRTQKDDIFFSIPTPFSPQPDCVATAFAALAGFAYDEVDFGIAVTQHCAAHLSRVFGFRVAGPVDAALAPAGLPVVQGGESADVLRRGDDGRWRIALDNPWGARILS